jgi:hypothetical protein
MKYLNTTFRTFSHTSHNTSISEKLLPYSFLICYPGQNTTMHDSGLHQQPNALSFDSGNQLKQFRFIHYIPNYQVQWHLAYHHQGITRMNRKTAW